jgi:hypothetical protein
MMVERVGVGFTVSSQLKVPPEGLLAVPFLLCLSEGYPVQATVILDVPNPVRQEWSDLRPLTLVQHGNVGFASPAIGCLRHILIPPWPNPRVSSQAASAVERLNANAINSQQLTANS